MRQKLKINTGDIFGKLTILHEELPRGKNRYVYVECQCGTKKSVGLRHLCNNKIISCGCEGKKNLKLVISHQLSNHPLYGIWSLMKDRCYNENSPSYKYYGERGIFVTKEWKDNFIKFYNWAILNNWKRGLQIDRKDNDKEYSSFNCRFVSRKENCRNRSNNTILTFRGQSKTLTEWAEIYNINIQTLHGRLFKFGWSLNDAFSTIPNPANRVKVR